MVLLDQQRRQLERTGAVANNNARLLAADANTRLYFQPNANYNGTLANAITFRAWDQTSGSQRHAGGYLDQRRHDGLLHSDRYGLPDRDGGERCAGGGSERRRGGPGCDDRVHGTDAGADRPGGDADRCGFGEPDLVDGDADGAARWQCGGVALAQCGGDGGGLRGGVDGELHGRDRGALDHGLGHDGGVPVDPAGHSVQRHERHADHEQPDDHRGGERRDRQERDADGDADRGGGERCAGGDDHAADVCGHRADQI